MKQLLLLYVIPCFTFMLKIFLRKVKFLSIFVVILSTHNNTTTMLFLSIINNILLSFLFYF